MLAYLSRYTHRVAISNSRLVAIDERGVTFRWKDYRAKGRTRYKTMTLAADEFMRRFLLHVLPGGFHRIRHYGLLANGSRKANLARVRELLHAVPAAALASHGQRCRDRARQAVLRLPALRRRDAHPSDLRARADDPRATPTATRSMSAIVCHVPTNRRLFIVPSRHGMTSSWAQFPWLVARDSRHQHADAAAAPGATPPPPIDAQGRSLPSSQVRPPNSP